MFFPNYETISDSDKNELMVLSHKLLESADSAVIGEITKLISKYSRISYKEITDRYVEINRTDWRLNEVSINVVSLFSGGGGLDLGFVAEGYNIIGRLITTKTLLKLIKVNIGDHIMCADINQIDICKIPHADVVIGGQSSVIFFGGK